MGQLPMTDDPPEKKGKRRKGIHEPPIVGASPFERLEAARSLVAAVAEHAEGLTDIHDVFRCVRGCLYALTRDEVLRVARDLVKMLKPSVEQLNKGATMRRDPDERDEDDDDDPHGPDIGGEG